MPIAFIAFGSNLGDRQKNIDNALKLLMREGVSLLKGSSIMETEPVGGPPGQGKFFNGVIKVETDLSPHELLQKLLSIEKQLGRIRSVRNAPRIIDLDILCYDDIILDDPDLTIPHPRTKEREFVMKPLLEIEPDIFK